MQLTHGFARAAALAVLMMGTAPVALLAETPADTLVVPTRSTTSCRSTRRGL
jgi:peptide/nickel transport system substrate-binding protein